MHGIARLKQIFVMINIIALGVNLVLCKEWLKEYTRPVMGDVNPLPIKKSDVSGSIELKAETKNEVKESKYCLVLVTGVAGYVGSHTAFQLLEDGYDVVGLDNMSRGSQRALDILSKYEKFSFEHVDLANKHAINKVFQKYAISAILHLASYAFVEESVHDPKLYKRNIEDNTENIVDAMIKHKVSKLVFASSCDVYGNAKNIPMTENTPTLPISPYGKSKLAAERIIKSRASSSLIFQARILRYFYAVGANSKGGLGENPRPDLATYNRLWTSCMDVIHGRSSCVSITSDKQFRDYVHVEDVSRANIAALQNTLKEQPYNQRQNVQIWNVATNKTTSMKMFVATTRSVVGDMSSIPICSIEKGRTVMGTHGANIVQGSAEKLTLATGWKPQFSTLKSMLTTAWNYSKAKPKETAIVMFDTRSLKGGVNSSYGYWCWTAGLNNRYARRHNYDFIYIHADSYNDYSSKSQGVDLKHDGTNSKYKTRAQCVLDMPSKNLTVERGAPWCKLLGIASVFERGYSTVAFIDSDAWFHENAPDISTIVHKYRNLKPYSLEPLVWLPSDGPWHRNAPNSGMHIWQTTSPAAWKLLRQWWQLDKSPLEHPYEQDSLWELINQKEGEISMKPCGVGLLRLPYMDILKKNWRKLPVLHLSSPIKDRRQRVIRPKFQRLIHKMEETYSKVIVMNHTETVRLQRLLGEEGDNDAC